MPSLQILPTNPKTSGQSSPTLLSPSLFLPLPDTRRATFTMGIDCYGVWKEKLLRYDYLQDWDGVELEDHPYLCVYFDDGAYGEARAAINIKSGNPNLSRIVYWVVPDLEHPMLEKLRKISCGFRMLEDIREINPGGIGLDYLRGDYFEKERGRILPYDDEGTHTIIEVRDLVKRAIEAEADVYLFGCPFDDGKGMHEIHMNQGNPPMWGEENGVWQDGGILVEFDDH